MYNAGTTGLRSADLPLVNQVLALTDALLEVSLLHVMEQFAFSLTIAQAGPVGEAAPYILHYWHMKDIRPVLAEFVVRHAGQPFATLLAVAARVPVVELSRKKDRWERTPRLLRGGLRAIGLRWKIDTEAALK